MGSSPEPGIRFEPGDGFERVAFEATFEIEAPDFGATLAPAVSPGTLGSWLAARLAALTGRDPHIFTGELEVEDDGLFIADLLAVDAGGRVLAKLQLQATPALVALLGVASSAESAGRAEAALRAWLCAEPEALEDVEVQIESAAGRVRYGRRAGQLLVG